MTILLFIVVLVALIVVHELGHFFAAKWSGMKVEEFGIGYPPRALTVAKHKGTEYTLNWLPFGGFVKIKGEDGGDKAGDSFVGKPYHVQALVIAAGIIMNIVFAWVLLSGTLALGMPRVLTDAEAAQAPDARLIISRVVPETPAEEAGLLAGDVVLKAIVGEEEFAETATEGFTAFVAKHEGVPVTLMVKRGEEELLLSALPEKGLVATEPERAALGIGIAAVGTISVPFYEAPIEGAKLTWSVTEQVAVGLAQFFTGIFTLSADLSQVSGPLGIAGAVGDASENGLVALLTLTAIISVNLALINIIPIPALDGGRLLFIIVEWITKKPIPAKIAGAANGIGFMFLIFLMLLVTASDIFKAFG